MIKYFIIEFELLQGLFTHYYSSKKGSCDLRFEIEGKVKRPSHLHVKKYIHIPVIKYSVVTKLLERQRRRCR